jgi:hypothetical protein
LFDSGRVHRLALQGVYDIPVPGGRDRLGSGGEDGVRCDPGQIPNFLPLDATLAINTVRHDTLKVAARLEAELGEEQWSFIDGCPRDWAELPIPDGPITVGIDGGYVRSWEAKKKNFEVIVGKSTRWRSNATMMMQRWLRRRVNALVLCKRKIPNRNGGSLKS